MPAPTSLYPSEERVVVFGRRFVLRCSGPVPPGRYEVRIWEGRRLPWRRQYLRAPIRGRDPDEARERALEVLRNYVGLERFRLMAETVARGIVPLGDVVVSEDAREIVVALTGRYVLEVPLAIPRQEVLGQEADLTPLRGLVKAHLEAYARPR